MRGATQEQVTSGGVGPAASLGLPMVRRRQRGRLAPLSGIWRFRGRSAGAVQQVV